MDYKRVILEMLDKADHDQMHVIYTFIVAFLGLK